ncbi:protein kinase domain-containing protein [Roseateles sp.]|uniref:protein kinase domain-containing protein n=1 Tax=Roseateles sp. TaxID=1971397 RepID=UPI004035AFF1
MDDSSANPVLATRYDIKRLIGRGGAGSVHEAWDRQLERAVAIKRVDWGSGDALVEARLAAGLSHPAIVDIHDVVSQADSVCIVMELVQGRTLAAVVADGPTDPLQARAWVAEVADALVQAHAAGIVHGDIKPGNLMLDNAGRMRILDFGIARRVDVLKTASGPITPVGTLRYMAPEVLLGARPGQAADIYSLGLVLFELLQGAQAFAGEGDFALAHRKLSETAGPVPPELAAADPLCALAERMTRREPAQRPPGMAEVARALRQPGLRTDGPAGQHPRLPWRWRLRRAALPISLLAGAVALGGGVIIATRSQPAATQAPTLTPQESVSRARRLLMRFDEAGHLDRAVALLKGVLEAHSHHAPAAAMLAIAYCLRDGSDASDAVWLERANAASQIALQADDQLAVAQAARGRYLAASGQAGLALQAYERALVLDPRDFHALLGKAELLTKQQHAEPARQALDAALTAHPEEPVLHNALGTLLYQGGRYAEAETAFRTAVRLAPLVAAGYANLAATLQRLGRGDDALEVLQQGLAARPEGRLYSNLGTALFARGRYAEAASAFESAVSESKGNPNDYLKWANLADALRWVPGREVGSLAAYRHALQLLSPRLERDKPEPTHLSRAGVYAARLGEAAQSRAWTEAAVAAAPKSPDVAFRACMAYELSGDRTQALRQLQRALKLGYPLSFVEQEPDLQALRRSRAFHQTITQGLP